MIKTIKPLKIKVRTKSYSSMKKPSGRPKALVTTVLISQLSYEVVFAFDKLRHHEQLLGSEINGYITGYIRDSGLKTKISLCDLELTDEGLKPINSLTFVLAPYKKQVWRFKASYNSLMTAILKNGFIVGLYPVEQCKSWNMGTDLREQLKQFDF